jgi:integrase
MQKPKKPYPDFPLFAHDRGYWAKCIKRKFYYFGPWDDPSGALAEYERVRDDLYNGRSPSPDSSGHNLKDAINFWLAERKTDTDSGSLSVDTWKEYQRIGKRVVACLGTTVSVDSLTPDHFSRLRLFLTEGYALKSAKNNIRKARLLFRWIYTSGRSEKELRYHEALKPPAKGALRREQANKPTKVFTPEEVKLLIKASSGYMTPGIYLAINCGYGNKDLVELKWSYIEGTYVNYDRVKTGVRRRASLWPETIKALLAWKKESPESEYVCCGARGQKLGGETNNTPVPHLFTKVAQAGGVVTNGRGFYSLRHTYRTVADGTKDLVAIDLTMGHSDNRMGSDYTHGIDDKRLDDIAKLVRKWLLAK